MRLLLLAAAASAATAAGDGCSTGCNLALGSYTIAPNQNLTYIASLFDIDNYRSLERSVAANFNNLTAASWLQATSSYPSNNNNLDSVTVMNVTVNCSCGDPGVSPDYKLFLTYPLGDGETFDSVAENNGFLLQSDMELFRKYNPQNNSRIVYLPLRASVSSVFGVSTILISLFLWYKKYYGMLPWQRGSRNAPRIESFLQKQGTAHPKRYSYSEVRRMTKSFAHKLGQGGYGAVYRGNLPDSREDFAFKVQRELFSMSICPMVHLREMLLATILLKGTRDKLFDIIVGIARGLEYLYYRCNTPIVHFDIKPQNIRLDQSFCPKISDFGLAKLCQQKESKISIAGARGTISHIAPEVFNRSYGAVSNKSDVYSYGMVVLEMVGARKQIDANTDNSSKYFPQWLCDNLDQFCGATTIYCEISGNTTELVRKMIIVGLWCIQFKPADRPSMSKVLEMLESSTVELQLPQNAFWAG
ncbi:putative receptor-like protein kinase [Dichanthelium oligosanthes]|uniref:Putative receptor-like protein kinase n=1 Tax=Dichanthelium oligosanthes TaxID=888268 RepID=A0A1E5WK96_9POAL|nr:putative receptor-like protein kinase [Dichanthelium oligosanthes]